MTYGILEFALGTIVSRLTTAVTQSFTTASGSLARARPTARRPGGPIHLPDGETESEELFRVWVFLCAASIVVASLTALARVKSASESNLF